MNRRLKKNKKWGHEIDPDEIFLDSQNMPDFDVQQFEGRIEKPISKKTVIILGIAFILIGVAFISRVGNFQITKGEKYLELSQKITLDKIAIFADRGTIYDRNEVPLAWNEIAKEGKEFSRRAYISTPGFSHLLGYLSYPKKDQSGFYWQKEFIGKDGIEKSFNFVLDGENGTKIIEVNAKRQIQSENVVIPPKAGANLTLSIDSRIQAKLNELINKWANIAKFKGGAGVLMNVDTGEVIALTNFPEYDSVLLTDGGNYQKVRELLEDSRKPFMNRAISGLYTPGSIVKPYFALGALAEGVIDPRKKILSTGSISIPNPYDPKKKSVFKDWRAHGWVDMRRALAVSSGVYFYEIGGGFEDQRGLGITNLEKYASLFGIGEKTGIDLPGEVGGIIPTPEWKQRVFKGDPWRIGDTYNTAIGQYGFQVTTIQMARAVSALANGGKILKPKIMIADNTNETAEIERTIDLPPSYFEIVNEGMRLAVTGGTATRLNVPFVKVAAKTGTAQVGAKNKFMNSWVTGFFPYGQPKYAFVILMERAPSTNQIGASNVMGELLEWMADNTAEYLSDQAPKLTMNEGS